MWSEDKGMAVIVRAPISISIWFYSSNGNFPVERNTQENPSRLYYCLKRQCAGCKIVGKKRECLVALLRAHILLIRCYNQSQQTEAFIWHPHYKHPLGWMLVMRMSNESWHWHGWIVNSMSMSRTSTGKIRAVRSEAESYNSYLNLRKHGRFHLTSSSQSSSSQDCHRHR